MLFTGGMNIVHTAIEHLRPPTQAELARTCGQKPQAVTRWLRTGRVPAAHAIAIETATVGAVRCEDLRPDVTWQRDDAGNVTGYVVPIAPSEAKAA